MPAAWVGSRVKVCFVHEAATDLDGIYTGARTFPPQEVLNAAFKEP